MRFSLSLNSGHGPTAEAVKLAVLAEKNGLECVWYCQDLFQRDVWVKGDIRMDYLGFW